MNLKEYLTEYKALTLDIMEHINIDGNIKFLLEERDKILNEILYSDFNKNEIQELGKQLKLIELEDEMQKMIRVEKVNIKKKIQQLRMREQGNRQYLSANYSPYVNSRFDKRF